MNKQLLCKVGMLFIALFTASVHSFAQKPSCSPHTTNRAAALNQQKEDRPVKILDQYGNEFSPADITPEKGHGSRSGCNPNTCVAGLFTLHFQDAISSNGVGFDDCTASGGSTIGQLRQAVACQVFRDLSNLLYDVSGGTNNGRVNIWMLSNTSYTSSIAPWPSGVGGINSAFFILPNGLNNVVVDNEIWKTIRGGSNSYTGLPSQFNPAGSTGLYHGMIAINFTGSSWNLNLDIQNPAGFTDLYQVLLHEAIHGLGFGSLVGSNGASQIGADIYSRYDTYLRLNSTPLISFTAPNNWAYTGGLANLGINCSSSQLFNFNGASLINQSVFTQAAWSSGTNLSHFGCDLANGSICGASYAQPASDYVMNPCAGQGPSFTKRHPNLSEVRSLCDMGYRLKVSSGNATYGDAPSLTAAAETYILSTFADCSGACVATGYADNFTTAFDQNITINHSTILANDKDNSGTALTTGTVNYPILYTTGAGAITLNAGNFVFDPNSNFVGTAVVGYYPRCNGSATNGNLTFVFINVSAPVLPLCTAPGLCNMICNGDFEASDYAVSWSNLDVQGTNSNSTDLFEFDGTSTARLNPSTGLPISYVWPYGCKGLFVNDTIRDPHPTGGNQYIGIGGDPGNIESITFHLNAPMVGGSQYRLSFLASGPGGATTGCYPVKLRVHGDDMLPCPITQTTLITGAASACGFTAINLGASANIDTPLWKPYSIIINAPSTITDLVLTLDTGKQPSTMGLYGLFDNFDLRLVSAPAAVTVASVVQPAPPCINSNVQVTYTVCLAAGQASNANAIPFQLSLPPGFAIVGGVFNGAGQFTIPAGTLTTANPCIALNVILSMNPGLVLPGSSYTVALNPVGTTGGCVTGTNPQSLAVITPVAPAITFTKSASTITPVNGVDFTFNFQVCNQSPSTQPVTMTDVVPSGLTITNVNGWSQSGQTMTRAVSLSAGTQANPFCQQYSFTVRPAFAFSGATQCNYQFTTVTNTASAQYTGSTCNPVTSSVTLTVYSHRVVGSAVNIPTISQAVAQGMLLPGVGSPNSVSTAQTFTIAGTFNVDMNYQFGNGSSGVHSYAWCAPGASVTVNDYMKLTGYYLDFNACSQMWKGITVAGRYIFFNWEGELVLDHCQINDALYGVQALNMSKLSLTNNQFRECFVGLYLPYHASSFPVPNVVLTLPLAGNTFYSAGNMKAAYPGMVTAPQQPPVASIPATNRRTWAGINVDGWNSLAVGTTAGGYAVNSFIGTANGIVSDNTDLNIVSSSFDQHRAYGYNFNGKQGNGIFCSAQLMLQINGQPAYAYWGIYQRGFGYNQNGNCSVSMSNSDNGIVSSGMNLDVANNCFSVVGTGVTVSGAKYGAIRINSNNFITSNGAIALTNNDPVNITDISNNNIVNSGGLIALNIQEQNNPPVQYATIHHNKVTMSGNNWVGINLNGCTGVASLISSYNLYNNTVIMQNPASHLYGISIGSSHVIDGFLNAVGGDTWVSPATQNSVFTGYPVAIAYNNSDGRFFCDSTFRLYNGIKLFGTCLNTTFWGSVMNTHTYGFYISGGTTLQAQGSSTSSNGIRWRGTYTGGNAARNDNGSGSNIYVQGTAAPYWPAAVGTVVPSSGWVLSSTGAPYLCGAVVYGAGFKKEGEAQLSEAEKSVLNDELHFSNFETSLKWQNEKVVFEKLKAAPELALQDNDADLFYNIKRNTALGILSNLEGKKNLALQVAPSKRPEFTRLAAEKEALVTELINADNAISDKSSAQELDAWRSNKAAIQLKIDEVNKQLGTLRQVMDQARMQELTGIASANEHMSASLLIEKNQKLLNSIYLNTVAADKYTFTDEQLKDLKYLAGQCPLEGGEAVYRSRSLLSLVMDTFYDDYGLCAVAAKNVKKGSESAGTRGVDGLKLNTLPNPASSYLIIQSNISTEENLSVVVYDNMGRSVLEQPISLGSKQTRINTQLLASGLYYIKVFSPSSSPVYSGKFNIQR
jgi:hypothetical protein